MNHIPVLIKEVLSNFSPRNGDTLLDATLGLGGHAMAYLKEAGSDAHVIGFDADPGALKEARKNLKGFPEQVTYIRDSFANLTGALEQAAIERPITHILFDLGIGSHQIADESRGFSFEASGELSMRFGEGLSLPDSDIEALNALTRRIGHYPSAIELIRFLEQPDLAHVIRLYGEERYAGRIAGALLRHKDSNSASEVADVIKEAVPGAYAHGRIHPATRTFQALRLAVNRELESLKVALPQAVNVLSPHGKIAVISFHSLEDRIVKQFFRYESRDCVCPPKQPVCTCDKVAKLGIITKRPIRPSEVEQTRNPRSRSAKLRVAEKIE